MSKEITIKEKSLGITKIYDIQKPAEVLQMAKTLKAYVIKEKLYSNIKGKNFAQVEGWQFAGFLTGMNVIVDEPKNLSSGTEIKWFCSSHLYDKSEKLIANGFALCSSKEATKKGFDEYAIMSMAQTRSIGKVFRNKIGWVMKLAGYQATPAEEMHKVDEVVKEPQEIVIDRSQEPIEDYVCVGRGCGKDITKQEAEFSQKIYKKRLCRDCQKSVKNK